MGPGEGRMKGSRGQKGGREGVQKYTQRVLYTVPRMLQTFDLFPKYVGDISKQTTT